MTLICSLLTGFLLHDWFSLWPLGGTAVNVFLNNQNRNFKPFDSFFFSANDERKSNRALWRGKAEVPDREMQPKYGPLASFKIIKIFIKKSCIYHNDIQHRPDVFLNADLLGEGQRQDEEETEQH